jgi:uncharacterized protein YecT (DUF1311 family)
MSEDGDLQHVLREMAEKIGALTATVNSLEHTWRQQDEKASLGRRDTHAKIDALRAEVQQLDNRLTKAIDDVAEMKPTFEAVEAAKQRAMGAWMASRAMYALAIAVTAGFTWVASNWIRISIR